MKSHYVDMLIKPLLFIIVVPVKTFIATLVCAMFTLQHLASVQAASFKTIACIWHSQNFV